MRRAVVRTILLGALSVPLTLIGTPAGAQSRVGIRAGASADPDQFFFGGHVETRPLAEHLTFRPNVEVGVGNGTLVAINLEFAWWLPTRPKPWRVYLGGGPAAIIASHDEPHGHDEDTTDVGGGFNLLVGAQHRGGVFGELKVGLIDSPELKITIGYVFK